MITPAVVRSTLTKLLFVAWFGIALFALPDAAAAACMPYRSPSFDYMPYPSPTMGEAPLTVTGTETTNWSAPDDGTALTLNINWGDGAVTSVPYEVCPDYFTDGTLAGYYRNWAPRSFSHTYTEPGSYNPRMVTSTGGSFSLGTITVTMPIPKYLLSVSKTGTGSGTVTSVPSGISCGSTCSKQFNELSIVTLSASPATGSVFAGWSGACTNTSGTCQVEMSAAKSVTAGFTAQQVGTPGCPAGSTKSGSSWVALFPGSKSMDTLVSPFKENTKAFVAAIRNAGGTVSIAATYRPPERAYLMHYSFLIANGGIDPRNVPTKSGVNICWAHKNADGTFNLSASRTAAQQMVTGYGITSTVAPALSSNHTVGKAIDMSVSWSGTLAIKNKSGATVSITSTPRTGMNPTLWNVAKTYSVIKFGTQPGGNPQSDKPHWSVDGR